MDDEGARSRTTATRWRRVRKLPLLAALTAMAVLASVAPPVVRRLRAAQTSYVGTFTDFEFYLFAIGADLSTARRISGLPPLPALEDMNTAALAMHRKGVVATPQGGWLFQPGSWDDHPDYAYSGHHEVREGLEPRPSSGVASDASHSTRFAIWLRSHRAAAQAPDRAAYYDSLQAGLCRQFFTAVVEPPTPTRRLYRFRNFMDGRNGVYRLNYLNKGKTWGYGPYQLSGTVFLGWWSFLRTQGTAVMYEELAEQFPYTDAEIALFAGPSSSAGRYRDGRQRFLAQLASRIAAGSRKAPASRLAEEDSTWNRLLAPSLLEPLWSGPSAEAGQYPLMVPLHIGFAENRGEWQQQFAAHFAAFVRAEGRPPAATRLGRLHYLYFASRFLVLATEHRAVHLIPPGLRERIEHEVIELWEGNPGVVSHTGWGEPRYPNFRSYVSWKLGRATQYRLTPESQSLASSIPPGTCTPVSSVDNR